MLTRTEKFVLSKKEMEVIPRAKSVLDSIFLLCATLLFLGIIFYLPDHFRTLAAHIAYYCINDEDEGAESFKGSEL